MYNNTTTRLHTHFPKAIDLILWARKNYNIPSENWAYPYHHFGNPIDKYYAEIWTDGMDWNKNLWLIETKKREWPAPYPFIVFDDTKDSNKIPDFQMKEIIDAILWKRRNHLWIGHNDSYCGEEVFPYLKKESEETRTGWPEYMAKYSFEHNSQPKTVFWFNGSLI